MKIVKHWDEMPPTVYDGDEVFSTRVLEYKYRQMYGINDSINDLAWNKCVEGFDTKNISAREILEIIKPWADGVVDAH